MRKDKKVWHKVLSMLLVAALLITSAPQAYANSPTTYLEESPENKTETAEPNSGSDSTEGKDSTEETRTEEAENASSEEKSSKEGEEPSEEDQSEEEVEQVEGETPLEEGQPEGKDNPASGGEEGQIGSETPLEEGQTEGENAPIEEKKPGLIENAINAISTLLGFSPFSTGGNKTNDVTISDAKIQYSVGDAEPIVLNDLDDLEITIDETLTLSGTKDSAEVTFWLLYDFEIPDTITLNPNDYFYIEVPGNFPISEITNSIPLYDGETEYGSFSYDATENKLKVVLGDTIVAQNGISGTLGFETKIKVTQEELAGSENGEIKIPISESQEATIKFTYKPNRAVDAVTKNGIKVDSQDKIQWTVDINKGLNTINPAIITDIINQGSHHKYVDGSMTLNKLIINYADPNSEPTVGDSVSGFTPNVDGDGKSWTLDLGSITEAYRITYETEYDPGATEFSDNTFSLSNTVDFNGSPASNSVSVTKPNYIIKGVVSQPSNTNPTSFKWTITVNGDENQINGLRIEDQLPAGVKLTDITVSSPSGQTFSENTTGDLTYSVDANNLLTLRIGNTNEEWIIEYTTDIIDFKTRTNSAFKNTAKVFKEGSSNPQGATAEKTPTFTRGEGVLNKSGVYDNSTDYTADKRINWTITVNNAGAPLRNASVLDTIGDNHYLDVSSIKISENGTNMPDISTIIDTALLDEDSKNLTFTLSGSTPTTSKYVITYSTIVKATDVNKGPFTNDAELIYDNETGGPGPGWGFLPGDIDKEGNGVDIKTNTASKSGTILYNADHHINWTITINPTNAPMKEAVITDDFEEGLTLVGGTIVVKKGAATLNTTDHYDISYTGGGTNGEGATGFKITFKGAEALTGLTGSAYTIIYTAKYDRTKAIGSENNRTFENKATITFKELNIPTEKTIIAEASPEFNEVAYNNGYKEGRVIPERRAIEWKVYVNHLSTYPTGDFTLTDTIVGKPADQTLDMASFKVYAYAPNVNNGNQPANASSLGEPLDSTAEGFTITETSTGFTINFTQNKPYLIIYETNFTTRTVETYTNTAKVGDDEYTASVSFDEPSKTFAEKEGTVDGRNITWTVTLNESRSLINNAKVKDTLSGQQVYDEEYFIVTNKDTNEILTRNQDYFVTFHNNEPSGTESPYFELVWKNDSTINQMHEIEYRSFIYATKDSDMKNKIELTGENIDSTNDNTSETKTERFETSRGFGNITGAYSLILIKKIDNISNAPLKGAKFNLYERKDGQPNTFLAELETDDGGYASYLVKRNQSFVIKETKAPDGYILSETETVVNNPTAEVVIDNTKFTSAIHFKKVGENSTALAGAVFELYQDATLIDTATSNEQGDVYFYNLSNGDYIIKEKTAPEGYAISDTELHVTIAGKDSTYKVDGETVTAPYAFENEILKGTLLFKKVDSKDSTKTLRGAEFALYAKEVWESNETPKVPVAVKITTNADGIGEVKNLSYGEYVLIETKSPTGYYIRAAATEVDFKIDEAGKIIDLGNITNEKIPVGAIVIKKVDKDNISLGLESAEFEILDSDGNIIAIVKTDKDGIAIADGLLMNKTYTIKEIKAPSGYRINNETVSITLRENGDNAVTVENQKIPTDPDRPDRPDPDPDPKPPEKPKVPEKPVTPPEPEKPVIPPGPSPEPGPEPEEEGEIEIPDEEIPLVSVPPKNGKVTVDENGKWTYTRDPGFTGEDSFVIRVTHPDGTYEDILVEIPPLGSAEFATDKKKNPKTGIASNNMVYLVSGSMLLAGAFIFLTKKPNKSA